MTAKRSDEDPVRELRLEGGTLLGAAVLLLILLGAAFYVGRWYERGSGTTEGPAAVREEDPLAHVEEPIDVGAELDHFDAVEGEGKQLEPRREARRTAATPGPVATADDAAAGRYWVQVWAGRDRQAAELLVDKLKREGYGVRLISDRATTDTLFKVRVGGYGTETAAREAAAGLEGKGYRGAWITTAE